MVETAPPPSGTREKSLEALSTRALASQLAHKASELAQKELELARLEVRTDLRSELSMAEGFGAAGVCALLTVQLLLLAVVEALYEGGLAPAWLSSLILAALALATGSTAALLGWRKRVHTPLETTRRTLRDNIRWVKERTT